jgi:hypothetical protein
MPRDGSDRGGTELYFLSAQTFDGISGSAVLKVDTPLQDSAEVSEPQGGHFAFSEARIWAKEKRTGVELQASASRESYSLIT